MESITQKMEASLPASISRLLRDISVVANKSGQSLYMVGGSVRDLLLGRQIIDIDLATEGDGVLLAHELARSLGGTFKSSSQFGTAKIRLMGLDIDVASSRREIYNNPGALPTVMPGDIVDDLNRRDFTINAMAIYLDHSRYGDLVDFNHGKRDIEDRVIRVLHDKSFQDDATRMIRAVRYEQRLGFSINHHTLQHLANDIHNIHTISKDRLQKEIRRALGEERPARTLARLSRLGILESVHSPLGKYAKIADRVVELENSGLYNNSVLIYLASLACQITLSEGIKLIERLNMPKSWARVVKDTCQISESTKLHSRVLKNRDLYALLAGLDINAIRAASLLHYNEQAQWNLSFFLSNLDNISSMVSAHEIMALGVPQGPMVGKVMEELRDGILDGRIYTKKDAMILIQEFLTRKDSGENRP
jgi:tRNA nucleotidyltransferase (CCA-adding enzyme)